MKHLSLIFLSLLLGPGPFASAAPWAGPAQKPKLVVVVVIDQFRADYLSRFQTQFRKNGFAALIRDGAYFPYGEYDILQSMTAPGHATILTGAYPYQMGIPINEWYDQKSAAVMYCVDDKTVTEVGGNPAKTSSSPRNLIGTTVGDELKNADWPGKVVTVALKDRAAVLLGGHRADLAFWFSHESNKWVTSTYYRPQSDLPAWMIQLNSSLPKEQCHQDLPCAAEMTAAAFKAALVGEKLGSSAAPDILAVSFSGHDVAGHKFGPNADEMRVMTLAEDKALANMRAAVQAHVPGGLKNVVFVLTGDHGVAPTPAYLAHTGIDTGRINETALSEEINRELTKKHGSPKRGAWVAFVVDFNFYLNEENARAAHVEMSELEAEVKDVLLKHSEFVYVVTQADYEARRLPPGQFARQVLNTFYRGRSGHVIGLQKPFYITDDKNTATHLTGYSYDRTVPILFSGFGIKGGLYSTKAEVIDIAPTLSFLLGVIPPALSEGHVLSPALKTTP